jgi:hypothetical protein
MTKEQIKQLIIADELDVLDVIDAIIEANGIIGVGLITLGEDLKSHCTSYAHRQREEYVATPIDELIAIQYKQRECEKVMNKTASISIFTDKKVKEIEADMERFFEQRKHAETVQTDVISMYEEMSLNELLLYSIDYAGIVSFERLIRNVNSKKELIVVLQRVVQQLHKSYIEDSIKHMIKDIDKIDTTSSLITISYMYTYCKLPLNSMYNNFATELAKELSLNVSELQENLFEGVIKSVVDKQDLTTKLISLKTILNEYKVYGVQYLKHYLSTK